MLFCLDSVMTGYLYITAFCLSIALSNVWIKHADYDNSLLIFSSSLLNFLFYFLLHIKRLPSWREKVVTHLPNVALVNIATALAWISSNIYALPYIDPATQLCISLGTIPIASFFLFTPLKNYRESGFSMVALLATLISMGLIAYENIRRTGKPDQYMIGGVTAIIGGLGTTFVGHFSEKLNKANFSASEVIFSRFPLLLFISFLLAIKRGTLVQLKLADLKVLLASSFLVSLLTTFFYQSSIKKLGAFKASMFIPLSPICAYFMQMCIKQDDLEPRIFACILACSLAILFSNLAAHLYKKEKSTSLS